MKWIIFLSLLTFCLSTSRRHRRKHHSPNKRVKNNKIVDDFNKIPVIEQQTHMQVKDVCFIVECKRIPQDYQCECFVDQCVHQDGHFIKDQKIFKQQCDIQSLMGFNEKDCVQRVKNARVTTVPVGSWETDPNKYKEFMRKVHNKLNEKKKKKLQNKQ